MKKNIAVVTGGYSGEAEISYKSAATVLNNLDQETYNLYKVKITRDAWSLEMNEKSYPIDKNDFSATVNGDKITFDCVFNIIHGTPGEDGKFQGYLEMLNIPHTSCGVAVSSLTFNKGLTTRLLSTYDINTAKSVVVYKHLNPKAEDVLKNITIPCFVKPNNGGSSIGMSKVTDASQLERAIEKAFGADDQVIIEEFVDGTEVTCSAFSQNGKAKAMAITEIVSAVEFFDFDAKYQDARTQEITPARIPQDKYDECLRITEKVYDTLGCKGMIRIDFILSNNKWFLIEVNSIPGLTDRSLTPQHAEYINISKKDLFGMVIEQALENHKNG